MTSPSAVAAGHSAARPQHTAAPAATQQLAHRQQHAPRRPAALSPAAAAAAPARLASASLSSREQQLSAAEQARIVGMGAAIRALQKDLPALLDQAPSLDVYSESVVFEDRLSPRLGLPPASCAGREAYGRLCWSLRFHRMLFFRHAKVELQRMWEREPGVVCVRWSARAAPRLGDLVAPTQAGAHMSLDGVSEFRFDDAGLISRHELDCVAYSGMQLQGIPLLSRMARQQRAMVPGLAGGSWDEAASMDDC